MRIFSNLIEAIKEIERDLNEMGTLIHPESYQDQDIKNNDDFLTRELQGYCYKITNHVGLLQDFKSLGGNTDYVIQEFEDRVSSDLLNPGKSYLHRLEVWEPFLHKGKFSYTYNERIRTQLPKIMKELEERPNTRQAVISIFDWFMDLERLGGKARIPCSMYYQFLRRERNGVPALDCIYTMRSCDIYTHLIYDITLTMYIQQYIAHTLGINPGHFTHFVGSLHAYKKDYSIKGVF